MRETVRSLCAASVLLAFFCAFPVSCGLVFAEPAQAQIQIGPDKAERGPRFPWPAFVHFWNVRCKAGFEIKNPQSVNNRYIVPYGHTVSLVVEMRDDVVQSVSALYADPSILEGGMRWIKLVDSIITVGTYRWPEERIQAVRLRFQDITPTPEKYMWQNSSFRRQRNEQSSWEFHLDFLSDPVFDQD